MLGVLYFLTAGCGWFSGATSKPTASPAPKPTQQVQVVAQDLDVPWAIDFAPDGRMFVTERPGNIRIIQQGRLLQEPLITFPAPFVSEGEGGLLGLVLDPDFANNHYLYVYHSYRSGEGVLNRVLRLKEQNNKATMDKVLIDRIPGNLFHNGGRLKIGPDGLLYITTGDAQRPELAQDPSSLAGKILRIRLDGSIPRDNPFPNSPVYSLGHRNPQGLAWHPETRQLYSSEHGPSAHDEINLIEAGKNYGWPVIQGDQEALGMQRPIIHSGNTTWAPAGMTFVTRGPWRNQLLVANLRGQQILKLELTTGQPIQARSIQSLFQDVYGRIRDVVEGPDGTVYLLTSNRDGRGAPRALDDKIIRVEAE